MTGCCSLVRCSITCSVLNFVHVEYVAQWNVFCHEIMFFSHLLLIFYHGWGMKCLKVSIAFFGWSQNTYLRMPIAHCRPCVGVVRLQVTADEVCHLSLFCDDAKARKVLTSGNLLKAHIFVDHFYSRYV